jgi:hypothetical protein
MVQRIWRKAGLRPHRLERYMASDDPEFERKAAHIIGLYLHPPRHAAVFCVDEKTSEFGSQADGRQFFHRRFGGVHAFCTSSFGEPYAQRRFPLLEAGNVF